MTTSSKSPSFLWKSIISVGFLVTLLSFADAKNAPSTAVFSEVSPDYQRKLLPSGRYEPETYAFGKGIFLDRLGKDESLTALSFREICEILAVSLEEADYVPTPSPEETDLVIVVSWGRTTPFDRGLYNYTTDRIADSVNETARISASKNSLDQDSASPEEIQMARQMNSLQNSLAGQYEGQMDQMLALQQMEDDRRMHSSRYNAKLLGFYDKLQWAGQLWDSSMVHRFSIFDLLPEVENPRYFVILQAYDFQAMWKEKKKVMLWTTRFSIRAQRRRFDEQLQSMALAACQVYGADSKGLVQGLTPANVKLGELEYLGVVEEDEE